METTLAAPPGSLTAPISVLSKQSAVDTLSQGPLLSVLFPRWQFPACFTANLPTGNNMVLLGTSLGTLAFNKITKGAL